MQVYDSQDDMDKKEYRPAKDDSSMQAAWALILDPRPLVHELGSIPLETVRKALYKLYAHNFEAPEGFTLGRDVLLLSVIIGEARHCKTKVLSEVLKSLGVYEGAGAYYVVIDTGLDRPTLHAGAYIEDGLVETLLTIAALVREQAPLTEDRSLAQKLADELYIELEYQGYIEYCERLDIHKVQREEQAQLDALSEEDRLELEGYKRHIERLEKMHEKKLDKKRYKLSKKLLDEAWALVLAMIEKQGFADDNNIERLTHLVEDTLELAKLSKTAEMIEVWDSRSHALTELVQLRESVGQA